MVNLQGVKYSAKDGEVSFDVDTRIYPLDAVLGAAYVFVNKAYVLLDKKGASRIRVQLAGKEALDESGLRAMAGEFLNELLGQVLRERLAKRYGKLREALLAKALFSAAPGLAGTEGTEAQSGMAAVPEPSLEDLPPDSADYLDDPLGIATPWEEKYGKKAEKKDEPQD